MKTFIVLLMGYALISCSKNEPEPKFPPIGEIDATINGQKFPIWGAYSQVTLGSNPLNSKFQSVIAVRSVSNDGYIRMNAISFDFNLLLGDFTELPPDTTLLNDMQKKYYGGFTIRSEDGDALYANYKKDYSKRNTYSITSITDEEVTGSFTLNYQKVDGFQHPQFEDKYEVVCKRFVAKRR